MSKFSATSEPYAAIIKIRDENDCTQFRLEPVIGIQSDGENHYAVLAKDIVSEPRDYRILHLVSDRFAEETFKTVAYRSCTCVSIDFSDDEVYILKTVGRHRDDCAMRVSFE